MIRDIHGGRSFSITNLFKAHFFERAVPNPQSIHSLAKIFALVEPPSNGGEYANDQAPAPDQRNAMFVREIEGRRVWIGTHGQGLQSSRHLRQLDRATTF